MGKILLLGGVAWLGLTGFLCFAPQPAFGQSKSEKREAKLHFEKAEIHYKLGRFQQALDAYSKSYELYPLPEFLFNIGQCHRQLGQYERALFFFQGYLRDNPDAENRALVLDLIAEAKAGLKEQEQSGSSQQTVDTGESAGEIKIKELPVRENSLVEQIPKVVADEPAPVPFSPESVVHDQPQTSVYEKWWFWTIVGGAAIAVAGGTWFVLDSVRERSVLPSGSLGTLDRR